jgi:glycine cleavage system transcriptional repressor
VTLQAITVIGHDRPGIIAETTAALSDLGLNLEDSTMTLLRGHFAMMLLCAGDVPSGRIEAALGSLSADGTLDVVVRGVPEEATAEPVASSHVVTVHGADRPGIVSAVAAEVAAAGGNITDLTTRLAGGLYVLGAEVDLPDGTDLSALDASLRVTAERLGVGVSLRRMESDEL